jgi:hypothetical protein
MALDPTKLGRLSTACDALHRRMDAHTARRKDSAVQGQAYPGAGTYPGHGRPDGASGSFDLDMPAPTLPISTGRPDSDFSKLENKLAKKPGISDPAAVAAKIGREKLGQAEMTRRSVAGRKDSTTTLDQLRHNEIQLKQQLKDLDEQQIAIAGERKAVEAALARLRAQIQALSASERKTT